MKKRFRGFLPVVVDVETGGSNPPTDALLEVAAVFIEMDDEGKIFPGNTFAHHHVEPFKGSRLDPKALEINKIDPNHPFRLAVHEKEALTDLLDQIKQAVKRQSCQRAVLVGHNAWFDLHFIIAASKRCKFKNIPFHAFTTFDTATLGGIALGETVLSKAILGAGIPFDSKEAHSAIYDAEKTAELFCQLTNAWPDPKASS